MMDISSCEEEEYSLTSFFALTIEIQNSLFKKFFLFQGEFGIWNLDHLVIWGIPYAKTYGIPRNSAEFREKSTIKIPRNSAKFRGIPCIFQKIPYSAGSENSTSVDTLLEEVL